jgi:hypothetical protein
MSIIKHLLYHHIGKTADHYTKRENEDTITYDTN